MKIGARGKRGWIDFESEISFIVQKLDEAKKDIERKYLESGEEATLDKILYKYLKPIIEEERKLQPGTIVGEHHYAPEFFDDKANCVLDALNKLICLLELYLHEYVEKLDCK